MIGSAPHARGWLLIEHPGPWAPEALAGSGIDRAVLGGLSSAARASRARILLIRRPGRRQTGPRRAWMAIGPARSECGTWREAGDLLNAASALRALAVEQLAPGAAPGGEPVVLVCTHGMHDTCCAVRGRPVAAALAERWPEAVWECSHLGGDRFAANVVVLPGAAYYGNLDAESALTAVAEHLAGRLSLRWLRGLARYTPAAQAAIAEVHRRFGPLPASAVTADPVEQLDVHHWRVRVSAPGTRWLVAVVARRQEPAVLTCGAGSATPATTYVVTEISADPDPASPKTGR
jgi:hypothetical protein